MKKLKISTILISILSLLFIIFIFVFPNEVILAAKRGINLWFNILFPSLFPFIIGANMLINIGSINFIGALLEPIMRPIFNISGKGAFPCLIGLTSGCPVGAKITADLRNSKQINSFDSNRIMSICNNSSPLFMLGTVGISMFKNINIGIYTIFIIYLSAISTGLLFRFYGPKEKLNINKNNINILKYAYNSQINSRINNYKSLGTILSESIMNAMEIIVKVGGFVILFSVISEILSLTPFLLVIEYILSPLFSILNIDKCLYKGIILGFIEITNGINLISSVSAPLKQQVIVSICLIAWNGLSIHAQAISMVGNSDIKLLPYFIAKIIQTILACIYSNLFFPYIFL